ncbi:hypothetical protein Acr_01g0010710 [Actinidia rufa]|uniref:RRM domain-containing protein n=1 Tax=Actinidia rufa TaxID=165716 RepID=A0A7J0E4Q5_9ERIC|nr:hypothetical protein Acr_01g0010710 [Actinidia rufa]
MVITSAAATGSRCSSRGRRKRRSQGGVSKRNLQLSNPTTLQPTAPAVEDLQSSNPTTTAAAAAAVVDEEDDEPPVETLLEGFEKKSLVVLAKQVVSKYPEDLMEKDLHSLFSKWGEINGENAGDPSPCGSTFKNRNAVRKALKQPRKVLEGKTFWCEPSK